MIKRFAALLVLLSVVSVTIVHACSGLAGMHVASVDNPSDNPMMADQPCNQTKPHHSIACESVRYRMLSIEAESSQNSLTLLPSALHTISLAYLLTLDRLLAAPPGAAAVDSLSRYSPRFSHIVLLI